MRALRRFRARGFLDTANASPRTFGVNELDSFKSALGHSLVDVHFAANHERLRAMIMHPLPNHV